MDTARSGEDASQPFEEDPRYRVSVKEAWVSIGYWVLFTAAMISVAWGIGGNRAAEETRFVLGFPDWFFWSALVTTAVFATVVPYLMIKYLFTEVSLESDTEERP